MKPCPSCALELPDDAVTCPRCGADLAPGVALPAPPASDEPLQYSHSGTRFLLGYGADFFGIWDRQAPAHPVDRYPRTDDGWRDAWRAFSAREPQSAAVGIAPTGWADAPAAVAEAPASRPNPVATASLVLGILGLFLGVLSVVALVLGYRARAAAAARGVAPGPATAGIVLGWVGLALWILWLLLLASGTVDNPLALQA